jgi:hypothetical protein
MVVTSLRSRAHRLGGAAFQAFLPDRARRGLRTFRCWCGLVANRRRLLRPARSGKGLRPQYLAFEGTNVCNAKCVFCGYGTMSRPKTTMPMDLFRRVVDEYAALGGTQIGLTPIVGDPLLDRNLLDRLDYIAGVPGIAGCHLHTNGIALRPALAERLLDYGAALSVNVSMGGCDAESYAKSMGVDRFDIVVANLEHLIAVKEERRSRLRLSVKLRAPEAGRAGSVFESFRAHARAGRLVLSYLSDFDSWAGAVQPEDLQAAGLKVRDPAPRGGVCYWLLTAPVALADGRVNACACRDVDASLVIGDLAREPLDRVLDGPRIREIVWRQESGDFPEVCRSCTLYSPIWFRWLLERDYPNEEMVSGNGRG